MRYILILSLSFILTACGSQPEHAPLADLESPHLVARGNSLVRGLAACGICHGETSDPSAMLTGGRMMGDRYGSVAAANITPAKSGVGDWTPLEMMRAIRGSASKEDRYFSTQVHGGYEWMSDDDVMAVVAYLQNLPPVENKIQRREVGFTDRNTKGLLESRDEVFGFVPAISPIEKVAYGRYMVEHVARCGVCHNAPDGLVGSGAYLSGGDTVEVDGEIKVAPAINNSVITGIGEWKEGDVKRYLYLGITPDGRMIDRDFCPIDYYSQAEERDIEAIAAYLKNIGSISE